MNTKHACWYTTPGPASRSGCAPRCCWLIVHFYTSSILLSGGRDINHYVAFQNYVACENYVHDALTCETYSTQKPCGREKVGDCRKVVSFPDPHTQQRMDIANAYQAGDETSRKAGGLRKPVIFGTDFTP